MSNAMNVLSHLTKDGWVVSSVAIVHISGTTIELRKKSSFVRPRRERVDNATWMFDEYASIHSKNERGLTNRFKIKRSGAMITDVESKLIEHGRSEAPLFWVIEHILTARRGNAWHSGYSSRNYIHAIAQALLLKRFPQRILRHYGA